MHRAPWFSRCKRRIDEARYLIKKEKFFIMNKIKSNKQFVRIVTFFLKIISLFVSLQFRIFASYTVLMPALKGQRKQLTTAESNESRIVTKVRWVVEAIHGILGEKYHLWHQQVDNKLVPKIKSYCRIVSFLNNKFGNRSDSDSGLCEQILTQIKDKNCTVNSLSSLDPINLINLCHI